MFSDMFEALEDGPRAARDLLRRLCRERGHGRLLPLGEEPRSWEPVELFEWRGGSTPRIAKTPETYEGQIVIKRELLPDGRQKLILKDPATGDFTDRIVAGVAERDRWRARSGSRRWSRRCWDGRARRTARTVGTAAGVRLDVAQDERQDLRDARERAGWW